MVTAARRGRARWILPLVAAGIIGIAQQSAAHPIHSTLTEIVRHPGRPLTVRIRTFADDFSQAAARFAGDRPSPTHEVRDDAAARYVSRFVRLEDGTGRSVGLSFVGQRREGDVVWLELRAAGGETEIRILNALLFDLHRDQVNVVQGTAPGVKRTLLFTRGDGLKRLL